MITIFVIYIILTAFATAGARATIFDEYNTFVTVLLCICFGWIVFPLIVAFTFGKIINYLNKYYG